MTELPTVLHSIDTGGPGGAETVFLRLAQGLSSSKPYAIAKAGGWVEEQLTKRGIPATCVDPMGTFNWPYLNTLIRIIRENRVRMIYSHLFGSSLYCSMAAVRCAIPLISVFHGAHDLAALQRLGPVKRRIIEYGSSRIIAVSDDLRKELIDAGFRDRVSLQVINNGVDTRRFRPQKNDTLRSDLGISDDTILVGAIGNIRAAKAYDVFVDAAKELSGRQLNYRFLIAGQGENSLHEELRKRISRHGLSEIVQFVGFIDQPEVVYNNLDVYVSSSSSEGFSISCIEAMACGVPVVATRSGGPEEIISDRVHGRLVPAGNPTELADAIDEVSSDRRLRDKLVKNGQVRAREDFSEATMLAMYDSLAAKLIQSD